MLNLLNFVKITYEWDNAERLVLICLIYFTMFCIKFVALFVSGHLLTLLIIYASAIPSNTLHDSETVGCRIMIAVPKVTGDLFFLFSSYFLSQCNISRCSTYLGQYRYNASFVSTKWQKLRAIFANIITEIISCFFL